MKAISKEQIDALQRYDPYKLIDDVDSVAIKLSDLRALYDNAPSVGGEPVGYLMTNGKFTQSETERNAHDLQNNDKALPVYTTPQHDRVAKGYALVPIEPTDAMIKAGMAVTKDKVAQQTDKLKYRAMITEAMKG